METNQSLPLISCICITKNRLAELQRAIILFQQQTYPTKELIICYPEEDTKTPEIINQILKTVDITIVQLKRSDSITIGEARNQAVKNSSGHYICLWDDDDLYYPTRLADQFNSLQTNIGNFDASILPHIIFYEATAHLGFLSYPSYWACTLLCKKNHLLAYPYEDKNDLEYVPIMEFLKSQNLFSPVQLNPFLYIYIYHGTNIIPYTTFLFFINQSDTLSNDDSRNIAIHLDLLKNNLSF